MHVGSWGSYEGHWKNSFLFLSPGLAFTKQELLFVLIRFDLVKGALFVSGPEDVNNIIYHMLASRQHVMHSNHGASNCLMIQGEMNLMFVD